MKSSRDPGEWPHQLVDSGDGLGPLVRKVARRLEAGSDDEAAAFARTQSVLLRRRTTARLGYVAGALACGAAVALLLTWSAPPWRGAGPASPQTTVAAKVPAPVAEPAAGPATPPPARVIVLGAKPVPLFSGRTELRDEAFVIIRDVARATAKLEGRGSSVALEDGRIELQVVHRPAERSFSVNAGPFRFVVVGTAFTVSRRQDRVELEVTEGRVAVVRGTRTLASVTAGGWWAGEADDGTSRPRKDLPKAEIAPAPAVAPIPSACEELISGQRWRDAIECLETHGAQGRGPANDVAAYEAARLWKDAVGDLPRAARAFTSYRTRFPQGSLRVEASLSLLEILPRLARYQEALAEADRVLAEPSAQPRYTEAHLVRGNVLRLGLGDRARALTDYRAAAAGTGRAADEGAYLSAVCLEELGRRDEAKQAFDRYLARAGSLRAIEAERHRRALDP